MRSIEFILIGALAGALGCAGHKQSTPSAGEYPRMNARLIENGRVLPVPTEGVGSIQLPSSLKLDNANHFALETEESEMSGVYFLERDSIFFVQHEKGQQRVIFAGRSFDDKLVVYWKSETATSASGPRLELTFVRDRSHDRR